ncbi:MAG: peptide chain release factor N(5)-glutamine methyltransferase [Chloroflexi bacterium]|nr:MAG: peptide chain release factor N(5)-glutamine methyltransferase [Chloroflexota bacterium]
MPTPTVIVALQHAQRQLQATSHSPRLDAELILAHLLDTTRTRLILHHTDLLADNVAERFADAITQRASGVPIAYLIKQREFYGYDFYVDARVLVPRPETELLVDMARHAAQRLGAHTIVDIGTGSGCIALSLAMQAAAPHVVAVDISADALAVAAINRQRLAPPVTVDLVQGDLCTVLRSVPVIVSNPPYTVLDDIDANVRQHEPHLALIGGGDDGADYYRRLAALLPTHLARPGFFACEIDPRQATIVSALLQQALPDAQITVSADLAGWERVVSAEIT